VLAFVRSPEALHDLPPLRRRRPVGLELLLRLPQARDRRHAVDPSGPAATLPPNAALEAATLARPGLVVAIALLDFLGAAAALLTGGLLLFAA